MIEYLIYVLVAPLAFIFMLLLVASVGAVVFGLVILPWGLVVYVVSGGRWCKWAPEMASPPVHYPRKR